jgi:mannitol/fructose-specific phosphotransferase system IIA component (Ntr-type)
MVLARILSRETVKLGISNVDKWTAIEELVDLMVERGLLDDRNAVLSAIVDREKRGSTGLENGIAVPHARSNGVGELVGVLGISKDGIDFESADGKPCYLIFLIVAPPQESTTYLKALADVTFIGSDEGRVSKLRYASSPDEVISILEQIRDGTS